YGTPDGFYLDIMANLGEATVFTDLEYEVIDYHGICVKVATLETLFRLKQNTMRDKDELDLLFLKELLQTRAATQPRRK
ncbi:hypothetical protein L0128_22340, partial [candidate division KSB1 bacterium]|nr:hypothetical protein [candidate division KSB1 bacterium]